MGRTSLGITYNTEINLRFNNVIKIENMRNQFDFWCWYQNLTIVAQCTLITAKLLDAVKWSWFIIMMPLIISTLLLILKVADKYYRNLKK